MSTLEIIAATSLVAQTLLAKRFIESWPLWIAVDSDATTTMHFAREYHGYAMPEVVQLAHQARERYDLFFLCDTDIPYEDTWDRSGQVHRIRMQRRIESDLIARKKCPLRFCEVRWNNAFNLSCRTQRFVVVYNHGLRRL